MSERGYQLNFSSQHPVQMYDSDLRRQKAEKVLRIIRDFLGETKNLKHLDIGCSTGFMTKIYSEGFHESFGVDIDEGAVAFAKEKNSAPNLSFRLADGMNTGFPDGTFDVVTCSHIYEHVPDAKRLVDEIHRVLKPGGVCFFAAGNRFAYMEGHYHLPFLAALPKFLGNYYVRFAGKAKFYYETHYSYWGLRRLVSRFELHDYTRKVIADPERFAATDLLTSGSMKQRLALVATRVAYWLIPTYLWILRKKSSVS